MPVPASSVFRGISLLLGVSAGYLFSCAYSIVNSSSSSPSSNNNSSSNDTSSNSSILTSALATIPVLVGLAGPLRMGLSPIQLPAEIKSTMVILGLCLPTAGIPYMYVGLTTPSNKQAVPWLVAHVVAGTSSLVAATIGFWRLSTKLPATLYIHEMISIVKSTGLLGGGSGDNDTIIADQEFRRWAPHGSVGVQVGLHAPDGPVVLLPDDNDDKNTQNTVSLHSLFPKNDDDKGLLVLNFGSYTCPHHRKRIDELHKLMDKYEKKDVSFLTVYTAEAHPEDGWALPNQYAQDEEYETCSNKDDFLFYHAKTIQDRKDMALWLKEKKHFRMKVVLDTMENKLLQAYNTWPIRLYIIQNNKILYCGSQGPFGYNPAEVDQVLQSHL